MSFLYTIGAEDGFLLGHHPAIPEFMYIWTEEGPAQEFVKRFPGYGVMPITIEEFLLFAKGLRDSGLTHVLLKEHDEHGDRTVTVEVAIEYYSQFVGEPPSHVRPVSEVHVSGIDDPVTRSMAADVQRLVDKGMTPDEAIGEIIRNPNRGGCLFVLVLLSVAALAGCLC